MAHVETRSGPIRGVERDGVCMFLGIPYAEPAVGALRLRAPVARAPWTDTFVADRVGQLAPQVPSPLEAMLVADQPIGEDCLSLNIWTPAADGAARPVLFWIHGGAFVTGAGSMPGYDGTAFARHHDVVVVTINYRLGALGFLHLADIAGPEWEGSGNVGLLDQALALRWVSDNIAGFGGDPSSITIFGESAGAMSVGTHLGLPASKGLFARAIAQSGAAGHVHDRASATSVARRFLEVLGVAAADVARLRDVPTSDILAAQEQVSAERFDLGGDGLPFTPVVDGVTLPEHPLGAVAHGHARGVSLLIGTNHDEGTLFSLMDASFASFDETSLASRFAAFFGDGRAGAALDAYRKDRGDATAADVYNAALSDRAFRAPALRLANAQHTEGATYVYLFTMRSTAFDGQLRACHALELPFVWDNLDQAGGSFLTGPLTDEMRTLAKTMNESWAAFARSGSPTTASLPTWPAWDPDARPTMILGATCGVDHDPAGHEIDFWLGQA